MTIIRPRRRALVAVCAAMLLAGAALTAAAWLDTSQQTALPLAAKELAEGSQGTENGGAGGESAEAIVAARQWQEARTAPGVVAPGAYSAAFAQLTGLAATGGSWANITALKYDADDTEYRDYYSNSSGGAGKYVTGRVTGLAASDDGTVYAAGANGGVWRSTTGGGNWTPIADAIPTLSSGALELDQSGALWYATGEANTGGTSYVGNGVYRLASPRTAAFSIANRVGGTELESTTINAVRFTADKVWVATLRGVWWHSRTGDFGSPWRLSLVPSPAFLPESMETYLQNPAIQLGGSDTTANAPYKNIVNDLAIDPKNPNHVIAAVGWRSGDPTYNGFYETTDGGQTWTRINPTGAINPKEIGNVSFAYAADGSKLYAMNQSPTLLNKLTGTVNSYLDGIYVSNSGKIEGPWSKIGDSHKLANSGSALKQSVSGKGYGPGIQAWYNQLLIVDPTNPNHVVAGLEEVYETLDGGANWRTIGPYWNFYFPCWNVDATYPSEGVGNRCPLTTHPDQHAVAIGKVGGQQRLFIGNDGGVYSRPLNGGTVNANGNATDWKSLNDGTMDALQYYAVDVGRANPANTYTPPGTDSVIISGGLQDNGGSIVRLGAPDGEMNSNFGGDGGDVLVDPNDGCNIVQEYVVLAMRVTNKCARLLPGVDDPLAFLDLSKANTRSIAPPDINARFIAPFVASESNIAHWLAGGNTVWWQDKGFAIQSGAEWKPVKTWADPGKVTTALAMDGNTAIAAFCGPCNNAGFTRGVSIGTYNPVAKTWSWVDDSDGLPNRYVAGAAVDGSDLYVVMNGFSRRFTEGPGAAFGHVFKWNAVAGAWESIDGTGAGAFPDVPANSIEVLPSGALVVGTDLGVVYRAAGSNTWQRLGGNFPVTTAIDVELGPDGKLYVATHGRGIWRIGAPA